MTALDDEIRAEHDRRKAILDGYSAMPMPDEQQIKDGAHILSEIIDDAAPMNEHRYRFPAQQMLRYAAWLSRTDVVQEALARRLRAAYIVVTQSTMWPTDKQFLEMLTLMSKVGPVPGQGALDDVSAAAEKAYAILCSGTAPYSARECAASAVLSQVISELVVGEPPAIRDEHEAAYDRGRRDMLNAILSPNPEVARQLHDIRGDEGVEFTNIHGKLSFDLVFWVAAVAEQLGIEPKEDLNGVE